jgi:hypothetical protein
VFACLFVCVCTIWGLRLVFGGLQTEIEDQRSTFEFLGLRFVV